MFGSYEARCPAVAGGSREIAPGMTNADFDQSLSALAGERAR